MENKQPVKSTPIENLDDHPITDTKKPHFLGLITLGLIFGLFGLWAVLVKVDTTVLAGGDVISKGYKKLVVHPRGGIVKEIYVKDGDRVKKGQPLIKLDGSNIESELKNNIKQHDTLSIQSVRLEAEANLKSDADFTKIKNQLIDKNASKSTIEHEKKLLKSDLKALNLKLAMLKSRNDILTEQIKGLEDRIKYNQNILESYQKELQKWQNLYDRNMTDELKLFDNRRKINQILSDIDSAKSKIAEDKETIISNNQQIELEKANFEDKARNELKDVLLKISMLKNKIKSLQSSLNNIILKAPDAGVVSNMEIHAVGEVVPPNKPVATIVPESKKIVLEVMVNPTDIDKVHVGQKADVHFPSYVNPAAKSIQGVVTYVSADTTVPRGAKHPVYKAHVDITPKGMEAIKENGFDIIPGMPTSVYIKAGKRSFMSYILNPLESLIKGAFHAN